MYDTPSPGPGPHCLRVAGSLLVAVALLTGSLAFGQSAESDRVRDHLERAELALEHREYGLAVDEFGRAADLSDDAGIAKQAARMAYTYGFNARALEAASAGDRWTETVKKRCCTWPS